MALKLKELSTGIENIVKNMPNDKAKEITEDLQTFVNEASKKQPRRKWYEMSAEGLIDAAKTIGTIGKPVIETVQSISKLLRG